MKTELLQLHFLLLLHIIFAGLLCPKLPFIVLVLVLLLLLVLRLLLRYFSLSDETRLASFFFFDSNLNYYLF